MKKKLARFLKSNGPILYNLIIIIMLFTSKNSYLRTKGYLKSAFHSSPLNNEGMPLPWMNYSIIRMFEQRLTKDMRIFEYGSGYSTLFFSDHVLQVCSVEHDKSWYKTMSNRVPSNATIIHKELSDVEAYCGSVHNFEGTFDVIVIDGRERVKSVISCIAKLSPRGIVILDDSERERYAYAFEFMKELGFNSLDFEGLKPGGHRNVVSTVFYKSNNCLCI